MTLSHRRRHRLGALSLAAMVGGASLALAPAGANGQPASPEVLVNAFEGTFGVHEGLRRSHAKGICFEGTFPGNTTARSVSKASLFDGETRPVVGRFSMGGGNPRAPDKGKTVRGLAIKVGLPGGEEFVTAMLSAPVFFVSRPEKVAPFMASRRPDPATKAPDPTAVKAFNDANPDTKPQIEFLAGAPVPASYATVRYFGIHAFKAVAQEGTVRHVRWSFEPGVGAQDLTPVDLQGLPDEFLFDDLRRRLAVRPVSFDMRLQIAEAGDETSNPTVTWPETRPVIPAGRLTVTGLDPDNRSGCVDLTFDPLVLPSGLEASDDPVLLARSGAYAVSLSRRLSRSN